MLMQRETIKLSMPQIWLAEACERYVVPPALPPRLRVRKLGAEMNKSNSIVERKPRTASAKNWTLGALDS
jgi:hypothetical protein